MARKNNSRGSGKRSGSSSNSKRSGASRSGGSRSGSSRSSGSSSGSSSSRRAQSGQRSTQARSRGNTQSRSGQSAQRESQSTGLRGVGSRALSAVTEHPIPVAVIGAGLAMLLLENRTGLANAEKRMMRRGGELVDSARESLSEYTSTAREALSPVTERVSDQTSRIGGYLSNGASSVGQGVESAYEYSRDAVADAWERHPVMLCAGILAAGLAAGMLLPATRRENSLLGRTSDAVARKIRQQGRQIFEEGRVLAADAADTITETVNSLGLGEEESSGRNSSKNRNSRRSR